VLAALGAAVAVTGCASITNQTIAQQDVIGSVKLTTEFCSGVFGNLKVVSGVAPTKGANATTCETYGGSSSGQFLLAYQVPIGFTLPATLSGTQTQGGTGKSLSFTQDAGQKYAAAVAAQEGTLPTGHWVSYVSDVATIAATSEVPLSVSLSVLLPLPKSADGSPYQGPLLIKTTVGDRVVFDAPKSPLTADRPVDCNEALINQESAIGPAALRARDARAVLQALGRGHAAGKRARKAVRTVQPQTITCIDDNHDTFTPTNDLGILAGTPAASGLPGTTVAVPFNAEWAGAAANPAASFSLTAASNLAGATATPANATLTPPAGTDTTPSTTPETVNVAIPANATPGSYTTTLTAALTNGQTRSGTATFTVGTPPPPPPPPPTTVNNTTPTHANSGPPLSETLAELNPLTLTDLIQYGMPATFGCNKACDATLDLLLYLPPAHRARIAWHRVPTVLIGRFYSGVTAAGRKTSRIQLFHLPAGRLPHLGRFTLLVRTTATDVAGEHTTAIVRKVHLRPGCGGSDCVLH
jgi:hypothetical protein